jgi:hypothetical protein
MRFVVYDDESLEPITVLNLPITERDALEQRMWRVAVPVSFAEVVREPAEPSGYSTIKTVDLEFEPFQRNSQRHGRQDSVFCFTRATELAMLLNPAWLPGQRSAIDYLQSQNDALTRMLMGAFSQ